MWLFSLYRTLDTVEVHNIQGLTMHIDLFRNNDHILQLSGQRIALKLDLLIVARVWRLAFASYFTILFMLHHDLAYVAHIYFITLHINLFLRDDRM
jgi:hypothetical protein